MNYSYNNGYQQNYMRPYQPMQPMQQPMQQNWQQQPMPQNAADYQQGQSGGQELAQAIHRLCDVLEGMERRRGENG